MVRTGRYREYDPLAWFYHRYWNARYHSLVLPIVQETLLARIPLSACILDLCCGTGHLTGMLAERGFRMTGIDGSGEMLRYARKSVPAGRFIAADARSFTLPESFDAALSTFESINHLMSIEEVDAVFRNLHACLVEGGSFLFDFLLEEAYLTLWQKSSSLVGADHACILRGGYDPGSRVGRSDITLFRREGRGLKGEWKRRDVAIRERCHPPGDLRAALVGAGFTDIRFYDARKDFGMPGDLGVGRAFFLAKKPPIRTPDGKEERCF